MVLKDGVTIKKNLSLKKAIFKYFLINNINNKLIPYTFLNSQYLEWKNKNYTNCSCCKIIIEKKLKCQICNKYYYCDLCWDDYTYFCFYCNKHHCFICNFKRRSCKNCH